MRTSALQRAANDQKFETVLGFIQDSSRNEIIVAPHWVTNIRGRLKDAGYQLSDFTGVCGGLHSDWVTIRWEKK